MSHKSDIWSGCVTMINVLIGKGVNEVPDVQVCFIDTLCDIILDIIIIFISKLL